MRSSTIGTGRKTRDMGSAGRGGGVVGAATTRMACGATVSVKARAKSTIKIINSSSSSSLAYICSFSNPVSRRDLLTCDDGSCLMRCHRAFVSNSCHFFRSPLSLPWRHIQSLRDADQPVRKVPSRDGYPRRSARVVQRSVGDERPSSTAHLASPSMDSLYYPSSSQFQERCAP